MVSVKQHGFQKGALNPSCSIGPWNKGKKGTQVAWNKGLTKETYDTRLPKIAGPGRGKYYRTPETRHKISESLKGHPGHPTTPETRKKISEKTRLQWMKCDPIKYALPRGEVKRSQVRECKCNICGETFTTRQRNPKKMPQVCSVCRFHHCKMCGNLIDYRHTYCSPHCAQTDPTNEKVKFGHIVQGLAVSGEYNRMSNPVLREKARQGVIRSYTPELRKKRAQALVSQRSFLSYGKYVDGKGNLLKSTLELQVALELQRNGIDYKYEEPLWVGDKLFFPDFELPNGTLIEVAGFMISKQSIKLYKEKFRLILKGTDRPLIIVSYPEICPVFDNLRKTRFVDIVKLSDKAPKISTIKLDGVDTIDYAHVLPFHEGKCSRAHAHLSQIISVEVTGYISSYNYMVVDFGDIKKIVKEVSDKFDHKFVVGQKYYKGDGLVEWYSFSGKHQIIFPESEITRLEGEATIELMTDYFAQTLISRLPDNIISVVVEMTEGIGKRAIGRALKDVFIHRLPELVWIVDFHEHNKLWFNPIAKMGLGGDKEIQVDIRQYRDVYTLPTVEQMAQELLKILKALNPSLCYVRVWESDDAYCEVTG